MLVGVDAHDAAAQTPLTWTQVRTRFDANNPTLRAGQLTIDESRADEVTAALCGRIPICRSVAFSGISPAFGG